MTIIAGNWKMNHDSESCVSFLEEFESYGKIPKGIKAVVFPTQRLQLVCSEVAEVFAIL